MKRKRWHRGSGQSGVLSGLVRKGIGKVIPVGYRAKRGIFIVYGGGWSRGKIWLGGIEIESYLEPGI